MWRAGWDIESVGGEMRKIGVPVVGDLKARRYPDALMIHDVIEKPHQRSRAPRPPEHPAMQAYRHHLRRCFAFGIQNVETVLEIAKELVAAAEPLRIDEAHVVGIEAVGNDQMRSGRSLDPVRQIVG